MPFHIPNLRLFHCYRNNNALRIESARSSLTERRGERYNTNIRILNTRPSARGAAQRDGGFAMDLKLLLSYATVIKYKSFTAAAEKLGISQPTISTHIRLLEAELDTTLINRSAKSFEITPKGWEMYESAQRILGIWDNMLEHWGEEDAQLIRLGVSSIPSAYILPEVLPAFKKQFGAVRFEIGQADSQGIVDAVRGGSYDAGLVGMRVEDETLEFQPFYRDQMVLITPVEEPYLSMAGQDPPPLRELLAGPMILRERGSGSRRSAQFFLEQMGIEEEQLSVIARLNDQEAIKSLVAGGMGVSLISKLAVSGSRDAGRFLQFPLPEVFASRQFYLICQKGLLVPCISSFRDYLLQYYGQTARRN